MIAKTKRCEIVFLITILIFQVIFIRTFKYFILTDIYISFAKQIKFTTNHLSNYISITYYVFELLILYFLFKNYITDKGNYSTNSIKSKPKAIIVTLITCNAIFSIITSSFSMPIGTKFHNSFLGAAVSFLLLVLFAPIVEELFYRVIIINHLKKYYTLSSRKIILIQAILFYLGHVVNGQYTFYTFYGGIVSGIFYYYTGSIIYSVLLHCLSNFGFFIVSLNITNYRLPITPIGKIVGFLVLFAFFYGMLRQLVNILKQHRTCLDRIHYENTDA